MGYPVVIFNKPNPEKHKVVYNTLKELPAVIENSYDLVRITHYCNLVGIEPIYIIGMNRSERNMMPANYTFIMLIPTMFGVIKFTIMAEDLNFNNKTRAYNSDPIDQLRYKRFKIDEKTIRIDDLKFEKIITFGRYY